MDKPQSLPLYRRWWFWLVVAALLLGAVAWWMNLDEHTTEAPKAPLPMEQGAPEG